MSEFKFPKVSELTKDIQLMYASAGHVDTRKLLASSQDTVPAALKLLAADPDEGVRMLVAGNYATPPTVLFELLDNHRDLDVARTAASNPCLPAYAFQDYGTGDQVTLMILLENPNCPEDWATETRWYLQQP